MTTTAATGSTASSASAARSTAPSATTATAGAPVASVAPPSAPPPSATHRVAALLEGRVAFLAPGTGDRLVALRDEGGELVPWLREHGAWRSLPLPERAKARTGEARVGIFLGRDHRPRLMGFRASGSSTARVYLRHGAQGWRDQKSELGPLAADDAALFGELGEADPEIVCRVGDRCILKARSGWTNLREAPPVEALVRAFAGHGHVLVGDGLFRAGADGLARLGERGPWQGRVTGFWVGADGRAVVAEPDAGLLHRLEPKTGAWQSERAPVRGPRDVLGAPGERLVAGDGGLAHDGPGGWRTVEGAPALARLVATDHARYAAGPEGVFAIEERPSRP